MSQGDMYRIVAPTLGIMSVNGRRAIVTIPKNSVVEVVTNLPGNQRIVDVLWKSYPLLMFVQDLRERGHLDNSTDLKRVATLTPL